MPEKKSNKPKIEKTDDIKKALEVLFASQYINKRKLYLNNFLRGIAFGVGSVLGATVVVFILIWVLSLFEEIPLLGPVVDNLTDTIESRRR